MAPKKGVSPTITSPVREEPISPLMHKMFVGNGTPAEAPPKPQLDLMDIEFVRAWWWPTLLILWTIPTALYIPLTVDNFGGSMYRSFTEPTLWEAVSLMPTPSWEGAAVLLGWMLFQGLLLEFLPGKVIYGPPSPAGERPRYVDNGIISWVVTHGLYVILGPMTGIIKFGVLYDLWGTFICTANALTLPFCMFLYWKGKNYPSSRDAVWTGRPVFDFFQGIELHPRLMGVNLKQLLNCRFSMMGWSVAMLCFAEAQYDRGELSTGMIVLAALHVLYLLKFFWWEAGYFASIDIIHDRCGYYIIWGVVVWVPTIYCCPGYVLVQNPAHWPMWLAGGVFLIGCLALWINWDADHQRMHVRSKKGQCDVWGSPAKVIKAEYTTAEGETRQSLLLYSGYWGISRHFHYIPELTLAFCWSIPINSQLLLPWIYWIFLFFLLVDRSSRDDEKCRNKYGKYWKEYCKHVPYKIVPGIF